MRKNGVAETIAAGIEEGPGDRGSSIWGEGVPAPLRSVTQTGQTESGEWI
jgi:hypothetical protein